MLHLDILRIQCWNHEDYSKGKVRVDFELPLCAEMVRIMFFGVLLLRSIDLVRRPS